jgi:hypothetical protein
MMMVIIITIIIIASSLSVAENPIGFHADGNTSGFNGYTQIGSDSQHTPGESESVFSAFENNVSIEIDGSEQSIGRLSKVQSRPRSVDDPCTGRQSSANNGTAATPCGLQLRFHASNVPIRPPRI